MIILRQKEFGNRENKQKKRAWEARSGYNQAKKYLPYVDNDWHPALSRVRKEPLVTDIAVRNIGDGPRVTKHGVVVNSDALKAQEDLINYNRIGNERVRRGQKKVRGGKIEIERGENGINEELNNRLRYHKESDILDIKPSKKYTPQNTSDFTSLKDYKPTTPSTPTSSSVTTSKIVTPSPSPQVSPRVSGSVMVPNFAEKAAEEARKSVASTQPVALTPAPKSVMDNAKHKRIHSADKEWIKDLEGERENLQKEIRIKEDALSKANQDAVRERVAKEGVQKELKETAGKLTSEQAAHKTTQTAKEVAEKNAAKLGKSLRRWKIGSGVAMGAAAIGTGALAYRNKKK